MQCDTAPHHACTPQARHGALFHDQQRGQHRRRTRICNRGVCPSRLRRFLGCLQGQLHYSSNERDLSNCDDYDSFFDHYTFVVRELYRLTMPGRVTAVHCMDVPRSNSGTDSYIDFPGDIIRLHEREGWMYTGRRAIWKEPLAVRLRTMQKNLAHASLVADS